MGYDWSGRRTRTIYIAKFIVVAALVAAGASALAMTLPFQAKY